MVIALHQTDHSVDTTQTKCLGWSRSASIPCQLVNMLSSLSPGITQIAIAWDLAPPSPLRLRIHSSLLLRRDRPECQRGSCTLTPGMKSGFAQQVSRCWSAQNGCESPFVVALQMDHWPVLHDCCALLFQKFLCFSRVRPYLSRSLCTSHRSAQSQSKAGSTFMRLFGRRVTLRQDWRASI